MIKTLAKYLEYVRAMTRHFSKHECVFAWETFSELNVPYRNQKAATERAIMHQVADLMVEVTAVIKANDPLHRPVVFKISQK